MSLPGCHRQRTGSPGPEFVLNGRKYKRIPRMEYRPGMTGLASLLSLPSLEGDLERVEDALRRSVEAADPFLTEVASHLINAGGKRLRPALALTAAYLTSPDGAHRPALDDAVTGA